MSLGNSRWASLDQRASARAAVLARSRAGRWAAWLLAHSGDSQWWLAAGALLWWRGDARWATAGMQVVLVTVVSGIATAILKRIIRRPRPGPPGGLLYLAFDRHSFPSGHAARVAGIAVAVGVLVFPWGAAALWLWATGVGISRAALGVHYVTDVAAGMLLGAVIGVLVYLCCS